MTRRRNRPDRDRRPTAGTSLRSDPRERNAGEAIVTAARGALRDVRLALAAFDRDVPGYPLGTLPAVTDAAHKLAVAMKAAVTERERKENDHG